MKKRYILAQVAKLHARIDALEDKVNDMTNQSKDLTQAILAVTKLNGGHTHWTDEQYRSYGYVVAMKGYELRLSKELNHYHFLQAYLIDNLGKGDGIGTWINEDDGALYIDVVLWFTDYNDAILYAKQGNELAIFDIENQKSIKV